MPAQPSILNFFRAFRGHWFEAMSGAFSVPFAALAAFTEGYAQIIFVVLAASAGGFAAYRLWSFERQKVCDLKEQIRPRLKFERLIGSVDPASYDIELRNDGSEHLSNCLVRVEDLDITDGKAIKPKPQIVLRTKGQETRDHTGSFNLRPGERKALRLVYQSSGPNGFIALPHEDGSEFH